MKHTFLHRNALAILALLLMLAAGCKHEENVKSDELQLPSNEDILELYQPYLDGDFKEAVAQMQSCDNKPDEYKQQMMDFLALQQRRSQERRNGIAGVEASHVEAVGKRAANAFFKVTYGNGETETVMVTLVHDGEKWRLK